ncbi:MAG: DNA translocase FtsK [Bacteroidales bacterium]
MPASSALSRRLSEFLGVALFAAALIWFIALVTYDPADPAWFFNAGTHLPPANLIGRVGAFLAELSFQLAGYTAFVIPFVLGVLGWHYFWCSKLDAAYTKLIGAVLFFVCLSTFLNMAFGTTDPAGRSFQAGGYLGQHLAARLADYFNPTGSLIVILTFLFLSIIMSTQFSFGRFFASMSERASEAWYGAVDSVHTWREDRRKEKQRRSVIDKHTKAAAAAAASAQAKDKEIKDQKAQAPEIRKPAAVAKAAPSPEDAGRATQPSLPNVTPIKRPAPAAGTGDHEAASKAGRNGTFTLPPVALLDAPKAGHKIDERELMDMARQLEEKCREFAVEGSVVQIHPGPVVTTFEFKPDAGVKYSKITGLADDLSLALQAESVLIERIPGKSTVGIQIPNHNREQISLRDVLESDAYRRSSSKLTLAFGKTINGEPFVADLATMPHVLIAGSTGTGKSVAMNCMLTSILYRATPDDVRLIMIDPKRLELGMYEHIPHLLTPVVVDPKQAANALGWAVREMEERYKTLAAEGVRNIEQYNRNIRAALEEKGAGDEEERKTLPYIVVVIDELADLMMVASNEVEESIARLAQMARAVGIHLILATQRPSVDVITGLIKANLPARVSFRVSSKVDSRTILDGNGAEQLLGKGDMLFLPPASSRLIRLHGPYISEQESGRLAGFLRKQGKPVYDQTITAGEKQGESIEFEKDDLYDEAARIVVGSGQASISYLQRRLRIGFSRAARLVDMMEAEGLVSPAAGGKPREVLVDKGYFEEVDAQLR